MEDLRASPSEVFDFEGEELVLFFSGDVEAGTVTPGITGRFAGGLRASGDWRICIRNALSYTIRVPRGQALLQ